MDTSGGYIISAVITGLFGMVVVWQNWKLSQKTKTNHGKTIGQHAEDAAADAREAKLTSQLVALQLQEYKNDQASAALAEHTLIEGYVRDDAAAHKEIRSLILQVASSKGN